MRGARINYPKVSELPKDAMKISEYAKHLNVSVAYVYKLFKQGKISIVMYQGINFVL